MKAILVNKYYFISKHSLDFKLEKLSESFEAHIYAKPKSEIYSL